jgi:preprotein translocase subunit SecG
LLVLVQRGRGGGLAGALGGMGGQSAFGTKAGDLFTRVTIGVATFWILLCALAVATLNSPKDQLSSDLGSTATKAEEAARKLNAPPRSAAGEKSDDSAKDSSKAGPAKGDSSKSPAKPAAPAKSAGASAKPAGDSAKPAGDSAKPAAPSKTLPADDK